MVFHPPLQKLIVNGFFSRYTTLSVPVRRASSRNRVVNFVHGYFIGLTFFVDGLAQSTK